ncbi:uracil-DNA glycosylase [Patescibacteria group bacterium]|nr:MAG: uracil-DNA glycosylase [Patescibacteria group bacterium]
MDELEEFNQKVSKCQKCDLAESRMNVVPGEGNPNAEIMFIGEGPGFHEDQQGRPFVGAAGKFLEELLVSIDLKREDVFIANIIKCRPPNNRDPLPQEVEACLPWLKEQIEIIKPRLIVTLGRHSMDQFLPNLKITDVHAQPKRYKGQVYLPMYHPAAGLYRGNMRPVIEDDFKKIPQVLKKTDQLKEEDSSEASDKAKNNKVSELSNKDEQIGMF